MTQPILLTCPSVSFLKYFMTQLPRSFPGLLHARSHLRLPILPLQFPPPNQPFFTARFHAPPSQVRISPPGSHFPPGPHSPRPVSPLPFPNSPVQAVFFPFCACLSRRHTGRPAGRPEKHSTPEAPSGASPGTLSMHPPPPRRRRRESPAAARTARRQRSLPAVHAPACQQAGRHSSPPGRLAGRQGPPAFAAGRNRAAKKPCRRSAAPHRAALFCPAAHDRRRIRRRHAVPPIGGTTCRAAQSGGKPRMPIGVPKNRPHVEAPPVGGAKMPPAGWPAVGRDALRRPLRHPVGGSATPPVSCRRRRLTLTHSARMPERPAQRRQ